MKIVYSEEWSNIRKKPHKIISTEEAFNKDKKGESYVAVIYEDSILESVISINTKTYSVRFYEENQLLYLVYDFSKQKGQLFLNAVYHYEYEEGKKIQHTFFSFEENGKMIAERMNYLTNEVEEKEGEVDVSCNWEPIPSFGDYSSIMRKDR